MHLLFTLVEAASSQKLTGIEIKHSLGMTCFKICSYNMKEAVEVVDNYGRKM